MTYPSLVRKQECKTDIEVFLYSDEINEDGAPVITDHVKTKCNFQSSASQRYDKEHNIVEINSVALFNGDVFPHTPEITGGEVIVFNHTLNIRRGIKARNPDGTVNYTRLELL